MKLNLGINTLSIFKLEHFSLSQLKYYFLWLIFVMVSYYSYAQINPNDPRIPKNVDISKIDFNAITPGEIPDEAQLRAMGATDAEIAQILSIKKQKLEAEKSKEAKTMAQEKKEETVESKDAPVKEAVAEQKQETKVQDEVKIKTPPPPEVFGQSFFRNNSIRFYEKASDVKAPDDYILGVNDEINVSVWGFSDYSEVFRIDRDGYIKPKEAGRIYIKGMKFADAKSHLTKKFAEFLDLKNSNIEMSLIYSRVITVNMVGEVLNPGSYKIPAINTVFNALVVVNGTNQIGSLRKIQVKREGKVVKTLDLYKFLLNQDGQQEFYLEDNDYIFVPPAEKIVGIQGEIKRSYRYELIGNEDLQSLIKYAGGLKPESYTKAIQVRQFKNNQAVIIDIDLDSLLRYKKTFLLNDGDEVTLKSTSDIVENYVEIKGMVKIPGRFEFKNAEKITDLIKRAEGLVDESYLEFAYLTRRKDDFTNEYYKIQLSEILKNENSEFNIPLQKYDLLEIFSKKKFLDSSVFSVVGAVRNPNTYPFGEKVTIRDAINLSGGLIPEAYMERAFVIRENKVDQSRIYIPLNLNDIVTDNMDSANIFLQEKDILQIFLKKKFIDEYKISIVGAVREPGTYTFGSNLTVREALFLAGGLKIEAANHRIEVARLEDIFNKDKQKQRVIVKTAKISQNLEINDEMQDFQLMPYDQISVRVVPDFDFIENVSLLGEVNYPGIYSLIKKEERLSELIKRAGGLSPWAFPEKSRFVRKYQNIGMVFLNIKKTMNRPGTRWDYIMKPGDEIYIPKMNELVHLRGAIDYPGIDTLNQVSAPYSVSFLGFPKRANYYIKKYAGGFRREKVDDKWIKAQKRKMYVILPDGKVKRTLNLGLINIYPTPYKGSIIVVPFKPQPDAEKIKKESEPVDWNKAIANFTAGITAVLTFYLLSKNLANF